MTLSDKLQIANMSFMAVIAALIAINRWAYARVSTETNFEFRFEEIEKLRQERADRAEAEFKRLAVTVESNHVKAMTRCEDLHHLIDVWATRLVSLEQRTVAIEVWIDRPVRAKPSDDRSR